MVEDTADVARRLKGERPWLERRTVVFMSDFGTVDGAVSAMHGVADEVCRDLKLDDLTHEIPQFNIWEASYRLIQAMTYWAPGTVFVCVVDPGVGSDRKSVAVLTASGHVVVTPDNGTLTHVSRQVGIVERREISEAVNRLKDSQLSYTFHGRDVYAYTGARIAAGVIDFDQVGEVLDNQVVQLDVQDAVFDGKRIVGAIDILDTRYGSLWTNIPDSLFARLGVSHGDPVWVTIAYRGRIVYGYELKFCKNFTEVGRGEALLYINSLLNVGVAVNQGSFSAEYRIGTGEGWVITLEKGAGFR
ncbi:MAG: SAM hydrolase/SAM-dependent halogenase family protein [Sphaerochaetaceae bacterium]|jgi:S-adenosylmethionine hydrolase